MYGGCADAGASGGVQMPALVTMAALSMLWRRQVLLPAFVVQRLQVARPAGIGMTTKSIASWTVKRDVPSEPMGQPRGSPIVQY